MWNPFQNTYNQIIRSEEHQKNQEKLTAGGCGGQRLVILTLRYPFFLDASPTLQNEKMSQFSCIYSNVAVITTRQLWQQSGAGKQRSKLIGGLPQSKHLELFPSVWRHLNCALVNGKSRFTLYCKFQLNNTWGERNINWWVPSLLLANLVERR